jgi:hypothetical protein
MSWHLEPAVGEVRVGSQLDLTWGLVHKSQGTQGIREAKLIQNSVIKDYFITADDGKSHKTGLYNLAQMAPLYAIALAGPTPPPLTSSQSDNRIQDVPGYEKEYRMRW